MEKLDSRVSDPKKRGIIQCSRFGKQCSREYCVNCGRPGGIVTEDAISLMIWLCDDCFFTHGHIPGLQEMTDEAINQFLVNPKGR